MVEESPNAVIVSTATIYNLLMEVRDDVRDVKNSVANLAEDAADHERRLRDLEKGDPRIPALQQKVWAMSGAAGLAGGLLGFFLPKLIGG